MDIDQLTTPDTAPPDKSQLLNPAVAITLAQLRPNPRRGQADFAATIARYDSLAKDQSQKKDSLRKVAIQDQATYEALNYRDDQFDLSDSFIALAITMLALTALTQRRWRS